jgi:hypothetical protein
MNATLKIVPHSWVKRKAFPWRMCFRCGLVDLRNPLSQWAVQHGCDNDEHPDYRAVVRRFSKETH